MSQNEIADYKVENTCALLYIFLSLCLALILTRVCTCFIKWVALNIVAFSYVMTNLRNITNII